MNVIYWANVLNSLRGETVTYLKPSKHQLLGREFGSTDLVPQDQRPNQAEDELEVAVHDVFIAWKKFNGNTS